MLPIADFLTTSHPPGEAEWVWDELRANIFSEVGVATGPHFISMGSGNVQFRDVGRAPVKIIQVTGAALAELRGADLLGQYLHVIGSASNRVTRLDIACDFEVPPERTLRGLYARARSGNLCLTRKRIPPSECTWYESEAPDGRLGCTLYAGSPRGTRIRAYDKGRQLWTKYGIIPDGDLLRLEVQVKARLRPSLRDAWDPVALYWHLVSPDFWPAPAGVPSWVPYGEGFTMPARSGSLPAARVQAILDRSEELHILARQALAMGPTGVSQVQGAFNRRLQALVETLAKDAQGRAA